MPVYADACNIVGVKTTNHPIEYFKPEEITCLLAATFILMPKFRMLRSLEKDESTVTFL